MRKRLHVLGMATAALGLLIPLNLQAQNEAGPGRPGQYIVKTSEEAVLEELASRLGLQLSALITYPDPSPQTIAEFGDCYVVSVPDAVLASGSFAETLSALAGTVYVVPNARIHLDAGWQEPVSFPSGDVLKTPYTPNDPRYPDQWDKPIAETDKAWDVSKGDGVTVAILDTGVDTTHEDLVENLVAGYNFALNNEDIWDVAGHGTTVCGMACARMDNSKGVAGTAGRASLMMLRVMDNSGNMYTNWAVNAINYALDHDVKIISMSWGAYGDLGMSFAVTSAWQRGAFMCAGAANDNKDQRFYPAAYDKVMGVGASDPSDNRWSGSNYGSWVSIFAPGGVSTSRGGGYTGAQATSFTTPQIAALAALIWSAYPHATNQDVWDNIIQGADTIDSDVGEILRMNSCNAVSKEIIAVAEKPQTQSRVTAPAVARGVIRFQTELPRATAYKLQFFDASGRRVLEHQGLTGAGEIRINPGFSEGCYFWQFAAPGELATGKLVYMR